MFTQKPVRNEIINALQTASVVIVVCRGRTAFAFPSTCRTLCFRLLHIGTHAKVAVNQYYVFID